MQNTELKNCPFCGGETELFEDEPKQFYVGCVNPDCKVEAFLPFAKTKEEAIEAWNTRKPIDNMTRRLEEMFKHHNATKKVKRLVLEAVRSGGKV